MINRKVPPVRICAASFWLTVCITLFAVPSQGQQSQPSQQGQPGQQGQPSQQGQQGQPSQQGQQGQQGQPSQQGQQGQPSQQGQQGQQQQGQQRQQGRSFAGGGVAGQVIAGVRMEYGTNRSGATYRKLPTQSPEQCARECGADPRCVAMDYNYSHKYCSLKNRVTPPRPSNGAVSGVKISSGGNPPQQHHQPPPPRPNQQFGRVAGMQITPSLKRFGGDYRTLTVYNMEECARVCAQDRFCRSFNFGVQLRDCWLKNTVPHGTPDNTVISGYK